MQDPFEPPGVGLYRDHARPAGAVGRTRPARAQQGGRGAAGGAAAHAAGHLKELRGGTSAERRAAPGGPRGAAEPRGPGERQCKAGAAELHTLAAALPAEPLVGLEVGGSAPEGHVLAVQEGMNHS